MKFRRAVAYVGNCIICLYNDQLPAARRLYGFMKQSSWKKYIHGCFFSYINKSGSYWKFHCPDPGCSTEYNLTEGLWYHLQDVHSYPSPQAGSQASSCSRTEKDPFVGDYAAPNPHRNQPKRRRIREISTDLIEEDPFENQSETICATPSTLSILSTSCGSFNASTFPISEIDSHYAVNISN